MFGRKSYCRMTYVMRSGQRYIMDRLGSHREVEVPAPGSLVIWSVGDTDETGAVRSNSGFRIDLEQVALVMVEDRTGWGFNPNLRPVG